MAKKILIIDDEAEISRIFQIELQTEGFEIVLAHDGETGLAAAKEEKPDLIILDIIMPGMNGFEVLKKLKEDASLKDILIVIVTIKEQEKDIQDGLDLGAIDYFVKPVHLGLLVNKVKRLL